MKGGGELSKIFKYVCKVRGKQGGRSNEILFRGSCFWFALLLLLNVEDCVQSCVDCYSSENDVFICVWKSAQTFHWQVSRKACAFMRVVYWRC